MRFPNYSLPKIEQADIDAVTESVTTENNPLGIKWRDASEKMCSVCNSKKALNLFSWRKRENGLYYPSGPCGKCATKISKEWKERNQEKSSRWRENYYLGNRQAIIDRVDKWRKNNKDKVKEQNRTYNSRHPHTIKAKMHRRMSRKEKLPSDFTDADIKFALEFFDSKCAYCGNMYQEMDHFIPLSSSKCPGTVSGNMIPSCRFCNRSKGGVDPLVWIGRRFDDPYKIVAQIDEFFSAVRGAIDAL